MKRIHDIFEEFASYKTIWRAFDAIRRENKKKHRRKIHAFAKHIYENIMKIVKALRNKTWRMHPYKHIVRMEGRKLRDIWYSPDFIDLIVQRAFCMTIGRLLNKGLIKDTYAGIPGKSMHKAIRKIWRKTRRLKRLGRLWVYKSDFKKFYMSIDHDILKEKLRRKIKDKSMLWYLCHLIDSSPMSVGLPIGNMMSTVFANFYLNCVDRLPRRKGSVYSRYNDDIVHVSHDKEALRDYRTSLLNKAKEIKLEIKHEGNLYPVDSWGIDFVGYVIQDNRMLIRRRTERSLRGRAIRFHKRPTRHGAHGMSSYWGYCKRVESGRRLWYSCAGVSIEDFNTYVERLCA